VHTIANAQVNNSEQKNHESDLQTFLLDMSDMHNLIPSIEEVTGCQNELTTKEIWEKFDEPEN
jgi:endonuclease I